MLLIGIDEAGYGPPLGPFCHGYCALRLQDPVSDERFPDLWQMLAPAVARCPAPNGSIPVDDSKRLYSGPNKLERLFHSVRHFLHCTSAAESSANATLLKRLLLTEDLAEIEQDPWGGLQDTAEDLGAAENLRGTEGSSLAGKLSECGIRVVDYRSRAMSARAFNAQIAGCGNKAEVNWARAAALVRHALALALPGEPVHVVIDRHGGRKFYHSRLSELFGGSFVWTDTECAERSVYRTEFNGTSVRVEFCERAESESMPVALASMAAKLTRELLMNRFNAYFLSQDQALKPTAGYATDARRFLRDTQGLRQKLRIEDAVLVRKS